MRTIDLFPVLASAPWRDFFDGAGPNDSCALNTYVPRSQVSETKDNYAIEIDTPGISKEALKIDVDKRLLTVSGERKDRYQIRKQFNLPDDVEDEAIEASYVDGVLKLVLPKSAKTKSREIAIKA